MERGLRQGDPLSLFLFILVVDVLHRMVGEAVRNICIMPLLVGKDNIELSHLQFVDDTILFCPPEEETIRNYARLLRCFEMMSGLSINFDKSSLIPINCEQQWTSNMCNLLGYKEAYLPVRYLGIPLGANPRLVRTWKPIIDKVEEKLSLWKAKVLNKAGKLVFIKSMLNSLPVYYLSLYKMPKAVAEKLISLQRKFLWSKEEGRNGMALVKWEVVQAPKKLGGGLGVGDAVIRNAALMFKWWWCFSKEECPLWKKVVCSCYDLNPSVMLSAQILPTRGGPWKDICHLQLKDNTIKDKMIAGLSMEWRRALYQWELELVDLLHETLRPIKLSHDKPDRIFWKFDKEGIFSTNSFVQVWCQWLTEFGRSWTVPGSLKEQFESWTGAANRKVERNKWLICFFSVIWNVWLERNGRIFNNKEATAEVIVVLAEQRNESAETDGAEKIEEDKPLFFTSKFTTSLSFSTNKLLLLRFGFLSTIFHTINLFFDTADLVESASSISTFASID
ncbi:uncharacterized protein LOC107627434 [Arachis ipaensis]|uniref:uncharacterized protein LOC107627434 n=1 Tax=Arachis ipaensis TaxID=130454 RepID=UPI0007AF3B82|nr:uncharacterized protein LOC107627434 [Arachis ipaensis]